MLGRVLPLSRIIAISLSAIVAGGAVLSAYTVEEYVSKRTQEAIGRSISTQAKQLQDKLDRGLFERHRELTIAAAQFTSSASDQLLSIKHWIETRQRTDGDFAWLGVIDTSGQLLATASQYPAGEDFLSWPSVQTLLHQPERHDAESYFRNVHTAQGGNRTAQLIDMAAPILEASGRARAFLLASIDWHWAQEIGTSDASGNQDAKEKDVFVLSDRNDILLGPPTAEGYLSNLYSVRGARDGESSYKVETWPDGVRYITGFAQSDGHRGFRGFGWIVLVRQNAELALRPIKDLKRQIWTIAALFTLHGLIISWVLAGDIAAPLSRLSTAADALRLQENGQEIPVVSNYTEVQSLSKSLISLVSELKKRETAQANLATSLERQVKDRTAELEQQNVNLEEARIIAEIATHTKSRFLAAASHDLRQPLHALMLFVRALKRRATGHDVETLVANMEASVNSLSKMFDALLHVSRLDSGVISARIVPVPLHDLLGGLAAGFFAEALHRGLRFRCRSTRHIVLADPTLLETMLRNIVSNAVKFTKEGGILLASRVRGYRVLIEIYDTGPGIPPERIDAIFNEFERGRMKADGPNDGLGLGLSIVQRYAKLIGAEVSVTSRIGHGSRFTVSLPVHGFASGSFVAPLIAEETECLQQLNIMLLDDNAQVLDALGRDLTDHGAFVTAFETASEADEALQSGAAPDLMIVDYDLSGPETGLSFLERKKTDGSINFMSFILTGRTDTETLETISANGIAYLLKPADSVAIAALLRKLTDADLDAID